MKILVCGLPGSGKTTLSMHLRPMFNAIHLNADEVRKQADDWDFSEQGRLRQAERMRLMAAQKVMENRVVIADFVCPTKFARIEFGADYTIWMDTIKEGRFEDTNKMFEPPENPDFIVKHFEAEMWAFLIKQDILDKYGNLGPHSK